MYGVQEISPASLNTSWRAAPCMPDMCAPPVGAPISHVMLIAMFPPLYLPLYAILPLLQPNVQPPAYS